MVFNWSRMPVWSAPSATTRLHDLQLRKVKRHCKHFCCGSSESRAGTQSRGVFPLRGRASLEPSRFSKQLHHHSSFFLFHFNDSKSQKTCIKYPLDPLDIFAPLAQPHKPLLPPTTQVASALFFGGETCVYIETCALASLATPLQQQPSKMGLDRQTNKHTNTQEAAERPPVAAPPPPPFKGSPSRTERRHNPRPL